MVVSYDIHAYEFIRFNVIHLLSRDRVKGGWEVG